ncbi:MAG: AarF/ABC1/UbiB kinase family protein [Candidatus Margulisiibacteriota bacterium]|nr:AarF/ABC1/UbiB kinase family protein [Candidatus Margulisiibacteriota bacterium]
MRLSRFKSRKEHFERIAEITRVLAKYGFGYFFDRIQARKESIFSKNKERISRSREEFNASVPRRIRMALEELGSTAIKFGQIMSTREDLVGEEFAKELSLLHDNADPLPYKMVKLVIEAEFSCPLDLLFAKFDEEPLASASLAQVHKAVLENGDTVAVKVQRPGVIQQVKGDVAILRYFAKLVDKYSLSSKYFRTNMRKIVLEYERTVLKELDFIHEKMNIRKFADNFSSDEGICVPDVYDDYSTKRVLTMKFMEGVKISELEKSGIEYNRQVLAQRSTDSYLKQILIHGFYHADPHPGNILVMENNVIGYIDFGMMGHTDKDFVDDLVQAIFFMLDFDVSSLLGHFTNMGLLNDKVNLEVFKYDCMDLMSRYNGCKMSDIDFAEVTNKYVILFSRHHVNLPREMVLLSRSLMLMQNIAGTLDPEFDAQQVFKPYVGEILQRRRGFKKFIKLIEGNVFEFEHFLKTLPQSIKKVLKNLEDGKVNVALSSDSLDRLSDKSAASSNKIAVAMVVSSLVIGSSVALLSNKGPYLFGLPLVGVAGLAVSGLVGMGLYVLIMKPKDRS